MSVKSLVLSAGLTLMLFMVIFPPWVFVYDFQRPYREIKDVHMEHAAGYHPIWQTALAATPDELAALFGVAPRVEFFSMRLDVLRLSIQIAAVGILAALVLVVQSELAKRH